MTLIDRVDGLLAHVQAGLDIARGKNHPAAQIVELREGLQTAREELLALREEVTTLTREKGELEQRLAEASEFDEARGDFALVRLKTGSIVRVRKELDQGNADSPIYYCAECFEGGKKKMLHLKTQDFSRDVYECRACGLAALVPHDRNSGASFSVPRRSKWDDFP